MEYAVDVAKECHKLDIRTVAVTAGYICEEPRAEFFRYIDAANVDLKAFSEDFYSDICAGHLQPVLDTLLYLRRETDVWIELTDLIIPTDNDSDEELDAMTRWVVDELGPGTPMHFSAFHPDWKLRDRPSTPLRTLTRARDIAIGNGLRYVYTGNVHDPDSGSTYCHDCGRKLIGRDWYELGEWNLDGEGKCTGCGAKCPGVFDGPAGKWGRRQQPVRIESYGG